MARLYQSAASVGNPQKITISIWYNIPNAGDGRYRLLEFGGAGTNKRRSYIDVVANGSNISIQSLFVGPVVQHDQHSPDDTRGPLLVNQSPLVRSTTKDGAINASTFFDAWHHLALTLDISDWLPISSPPDINVYVTTKIFGSFPLPDGTVHRINVAFPKSEFNIVDPFVFPNFYGLPKASDIPVADIVEAIPTDDTSGPEAQVNIGSGQPATQVVKMRMVLDGIDQQEHHINFGPPWGDGLIDVTGEAVDFIETQANFASTDSFTGINLNGSGIGLPTQFTDWVSSIPEGSNKDENTVLSVKHRYSDVQIWCGTFIDLGIADNLSKFFTITDGVGKPVDPRIAEAAFGKPTFRFTGGATVNNTGTGGAFLKTGTINDFTPAPGQ